MVVRENCDINTDDGGKSIDSVMINEGVYKPVRAGLARADL